MPTVYRLADMLEIQRMLPEFQVEARPKKSAVSVLQLLTNQIQTIEKLKSCHLTMSRYSKRLPPCVVYVIASHHEEKEMPGMDSLMNFIIPNRKLNLGVGQASPEPPLLEFRKEAPSPLSYA